MPIYLSESLFKEISYNPNGQLYYDDSSIKGEWFDKSHLNLNAAWIVQVRKIWCQLATSEYTDADVEKACKDLELRQNIIDDIDGDNIIAAWSTQHDMWLLFSEYVWFYRYYKSITA